MIVSLSGILMDDMTFGRVSACRQEHTLIMQSTKNSIKNYSLLKQIVCLTGHRHCRPFGYHHIRRFH